MATVAEAVRHLRIQAEVKGDAAAISALNKIASAQAEVTKEFQQSERATQTAERRLESIRRQYDENYRAAQQLGRVERDLNLIREQGRIGLDEQNRLMALASSRIVGTAQQVATAGRTYGRFGTSIQQAGYQVGDFAVQVASGQNPVRAFIQQGTQLISMFGPWGAVIGAAGAVVGALATSMFDLGESTKKASEDQDAFNRTLDDAVALMDRINGKVEPTVAALKAVRQMQLTNAQGSLQFAESQLARTPEYETTEDPFGNTYVSRNSAYDEKQAEVKRLRNELTMLRADLQDFPDAWSRTIQQTGQATAQGTKPIETATAATGALRRELQATSLSVQELLDSFAPASQAFQDMARAEGALELAYERGRITAEEYSKALDELYSKSGFATPPAAAATGSATKPATKGGATDAIDATTQATMEAAGATVLWGRALDHVTSSGAQGLLGLATNATTARDALQQLLASLSQVASDAAASGLSDLLKFGISAIAGFFGPGDYISPGAATGATSSSGLAGGQIAFAEGGSFRVPGSGGIDSVPVSFRATPGEQVTISRPDQGGGAGGGIHISQNINITSNAGTPQQNQDQAERMAREMKTQVRTAVREVLREQRRPMHDLDFD